MDPNVQIKTNVGCKELLLKKLSYAVTCSVLMQIILLTVFIFTINWNPFGPKIWMTNSFEMLTSFWTWFYLVPFLSVMFAQSLICAKDYILRTTFNSTRIGSFLSIFSIRNVVLLILHVSSGAFFIWLYLGVLTTNKLYVKCEEDEDGYCLNEKCFYLVLFGVWIGLYYFLCVYTVDKKITFPVIQQKKLIRFQSNFISILKSCQKDAFLPVIIYVVVYHFYGGFIQDKITDIYVKKSEISTSYNLFTIFYSYFFATLYIFNLKLMRFFFEIFLTEPYEFSITTNDLPFKDLILKDAICLNSIPIVQHLACLDLFLLSTNSKHRRELIFTLSQPGNHPHNWNLLIEGILRILNEFTQSMNASIANILSYDEKKEEIPQNVTNQFVKKYNYGNIRNMALESFENPIEFVTINKEAKLEGKTQNFINKIKENVNNFIKILKRRTGIEYLFEELPTSNIQFLLSNGQIIIWTVQGLSSLTVASLTEDKFGVMQKDLPIILSSLVELRLSLEKLNRIPMKKNDKFNDSSNKMRININAAVKRSLYRICNKFSPYIKDLPLSNDVIQFLNVYTH